MSLQLSSVHATVRCPIGPPFLTADDRYPLVLLKAPLIGLLKGSLEDLEGQAVSGWAALLGKQLMGCQGCKGAC